jgi:mitochondrial fission protein ELM1
MSNQNISCWILSDGTIGMEVQSIALAESLSLNYKIKHIKPHWINKVFPSLAQFPGVPPSTRSTSKFTKPFPKILITCGHRHAGASIALKRISNGSIYTIHIQDPRINLKLFDLLIVPDHDPSRGNNVITSRGSLNRITPSLIRNEAQLISKQTKTLVGRKVAVNIGGNTKGFKVNNKLASSIALQLKIFADDHNCSLMITTATRTSESLKSTLASLTVNPNITLWTSGKPNPYLGFLGTADIIIVTSDSINMISEACSTGKPVYVLSLGKTTPRREKFLSSMIKEGKIRFFNGKFEIWAYEPLRETIRIADIIKSRLLIQKVN